MRLPKAVRLTENDVLEYERLKLEQEVLDQKVEDLRNKILNYCDYKKIRTVEFKSRTVQVDDVDRRYPNWKEWVLTLKGGKFVQKIYKKTKPTVVHYITIREKD